MVWTWKPRITLTTHTCDEYENITLDVSLKYWKGGSLFNLAVFLWHSSFFKLLHCLFITSCSSRSDPRKMGQAHHNKKRALKPIPVMYTLYLPCIINKHYAELRRIAPCTNDGRYLGRLVVNRSPIFGVKTNVMVIGFTRILTITLQNMLSIYYHVAKNNHIVDGAISRTLNAWNVNTGVKSYSF